MKFSNLLGVFFIIMASFMLVSFTYTNLNSKVQIQNGEYSNYLNASTQAGMNEAMLNNDTGYPFDKEYKRQKSVDAFYRNLASCFNYDVYEYNSIVRYYVPCVFLIDIDGYYVEYTETYTGASGLTEYKNIITPINKWGKLYKASTTGNTYYIEYRLDNTIKASRYSPNGNINEFEGTYDKVYKALGQPDILNNILNNQTNFETEKNEVIILDLTDKMTYYINTHDTFFNQKNNAQYQFTLPQIKDEDWARLVDQPTMFAFLQGMQTEYYGRYLNIYSMTAAEFTEALTYKLGNGTDGYLYYHRKDCPFLSPISPKEYTMDEAAMKGAYPCPDCIR